MVARIATVSSNGRPHLNPLYFVLADDHIHLGTADYTLAARNVRANPTVQILFEVESDPDDDLLLRVDGVATVRTDRELLRRYTRADARKYVLTPGGLWNFVTHPAQWLPMRRHVTGGRACVIDVEPTAAELLSRLA